MAEQYYFVCMCLCYQRWTHEPEEDVKEGNIEWTCFPFQDEDESFLRFYRFSFEGYKSFSRPQLDLPFYR